MVFAIFSQVPFMLFRTLVGEWRMLNILWTLLLGLLAIVVWDKLGKRYDCSIPLVILICLLGKYLQVDYGWYGVLCVFVLYLFREKGMLRIVAFSILNGIYYYPRLLTDDSTSSLVSYICATIPAVLLLFYNGKLGRKTKYWYYLFYPIHMILFYGIYRVIYLL